MTTNTATNSRRRPTLSEQIDRLDSVLDGLADNLNEAVADAVRSAVGAAVREAVTATLAELRTNPEVLARLRDLAMSVAPMPAAPAEPTSKKPTLWDRLGQLWQAVRGRLAGLRARCGAGLQRAGSGLGGLWRGAVQRCAAVWGRCRALAAYKYEFLTALTVGGTVAFVAWYAGPSLAALLSGVGGFCTSLAVQGWLWFRRMMTLDAERVA